MSLLQWIVSIAVGSIGLVIVVAVAIGDATLIAIPFGVAHFAYEFIRRPPSWRLTRAVKSLRRTFAQRQPPIVETRVAEWRRGVATVYLVCESDSECAALTTQLGDISVLLQRAAPQFQVPTGYVAAMRLWAISRSAVDREGGWFGFDHNVAHPDPPVGD